MEGLSRPTPTAFRLACRLRFRTHRRQTYRYINQMVIPLRCRHVEWLWELHFRRAIG
jgi:hypothetical protein